MERIPLPRFEPIRPEYGKEPFGDPAWSFELKYDGFRGLFSLWNGQARFVSRQDKVLHQFDMLADRIALQLAKKVQSAVFEGELVTNDETGRPIFKDILHRHGTPSYTAFDLVWLNGEDLRRLPLSERRKILRRMLPKNFKLIQQSYAVGGPLGRTLFDFVCEHDLEGVVAKRLADPYWKYVKWYKIKNRAYSQASGRRDFFDTVRRQAVR